MSNYFNFDLSLDILQSLVKIDPAPEVIWFYSDLNKNFYFKSSCLKQQGNTAIFPFSSQWSETGPLGSHVNLQHNIICELSLMQVTCRK